MCLCNAIISDVSRQTNPLQVAVAMTTISTTTILPDLAQQVIIFWHIQPYIVETDSNILKMNLCPPQLKYYMQLFN